MQASRLLRAGARVALVSPSGPIRDEAEIARAVENVQRFGWEPVIGDHARDVNAYLAGLDDHRTSDFNRAAADSSIDAVWCVRGGYGAMRMLPALDYEAWRIHPKALIGYSDITALHAAIGSRAELVTFHAPTARSDITSFSLDSFTRALVHGADPCGHAPHARTLRGGSASGRLAGGNLALLSALSGTPYAPDYRGAIVVIEDVNEQVYRIDRMLTQLWLTGALANCAAMVFGEFTDVPPERTDGQRGVDHVLAEFAERAGIPCISHAPIGHIADQWTVPLGATATLDADACTLTVAPWAPLQNG